MDLVLPREDGEEALGRNKYLGGNLGSSTFDSKLTA